MENQQQTTDLKTQIQGAGITIGTLISLGKSDLAEQVAQALHAKDPTDLDLKDFYASALYRLKRQIPLAASLALEVYHQRPREMNRLQGTSRCLMLAGRAPEAERLVREALNVDPHSLALLIELSYMLTVQGNFDSSLLILRNIVAKNPNHLVAHFHIGWHDIFAGRWEEGFKKQALGRRIWIWGAHGTFPVEACWDGISPFAADHVYLIGEGGVGDQFMTFGMANALAERTKKKVVFVVRSELFAIAKRSIESANVTVVREVPPNPSAPWVAGLEFGKMIPEGRPPFPVGSYLKPDPERVAKWKPILAAKIKGKSAGLRWSGDPNHELEPSRALPLQDVVNFAKAKPDVTFVPIYAEFEKVEMPKAENIVSLGEPIKDWEDSLAILSLLDSVVSSCTSVAHASAALGK
ncbi:MAG: tetratricopeptide repeat protein, partial [Bdellovibrionota bacterium]